MRKVGTEQKPLVNVYDTAYLLKTFAVVRFESDRVGHMLALENGIGSKPLIKDQEASVLVPAKRHRTQSCQHPSARSSVELI